MVLDQVSMYDTQYYLMGEIMLANHYNQSYATYDNIMYFRIVTLNLASNNKINSFNFTHGLDRLA